MPYNLKVQNEFQQIANDAWKFAKEHYTKEARDKFRHFIELNKFITDRFINEKPPYLLTSWLSQQILFNKELWRDYILYPSIESNTDYCNMAFHPNTVNSQMRFEKVIRVKIESINNDRISFSLGRVGELTPTNIQWRAVTDIEDKLFKDYGFEPQSN